MKLKSFGCSFIFGIDLHDDASHLDFGGYSHCTYPALLAKKLGYDYECFARAGAGNLQILHSLLDEISTGEPSLYVINWTWIDRFSYLDQSMENYCYPLGWRSIVPGDSSQLSDFYYRNLHSEMQDKLTSLVLIKNSIHALESAKSPFIMTYMDKLILDTKWHITPGMIDLQEYVKPYLSDFDGCNFLEWSKQKNYPISATNHPLEDAHIAAADLMEQTMHLRGNNASCFAENPN